MDGSFFREHFLPQRSSGRLAHIHGTSVTELPLSPPHIHELTTKIINIMALCLHSKRVPWQTRSPFREQFYPQGRANGINSASMKVIGGTPMNIWNTAPTHVRVNSGHVLPSLPRSHPSEIVFSQQPYHIESTTSSQRHRRLC